MLVVMKLCAIGNLSFAIKNISTPKTNSKTQDYLKNLQYFYSIQLKRNFVLLNCNFVNNKI